MSTEDCVLALTGGNGLFLFLAIGGVLLVAGVVVFFFVAKRRRAALASAALGMLMVMSLTVPSVPAQAASTSSGSCVSKTVTKTPAPTTPAPVTPKPTAPSKPTTPPEPVKKHPDLAASHTAPAGELAAGASSGIVFTLKNVGSVATVGETVATVALAPQSGFALAFDAASTMVTVDGVQVPVSNADFTVTGSGSAADPFVVRTSTVLGAGVSVSVGFTVTAPVGAAWSASSVSMVIVHGTGGGETPFGNNSTTAPVKAAAQVVPPCPISDKSTTRDTDGDGVVDACDLDSDNDGILDTEESAFSAGGFEGEDHEGNILIVPVLGDGVAAYRDLDSDNDGVLDLMEGRPFTRAEIDQFDTDHDGILDAGFSFGTNGLLDALETSPDSGTLRPEYTNLRNTSNGKGLPDFLNIRSNNSNFDLYAIGKDVFDTVGGGYIYPWDDGDKDGIPDVVDTDLTGRGAPGSPYSPYSN